MLQYQKKLLEFQKKFHINSLIVTGSVKKYIATYCFLKIKSNINYLIDIKYAKKVMHGDRITAIIYKENNKNFVKPKQLIKPYLDIFVGKICISNNNIFIKPHYPFLQECLICIDHKNNFHHINNGDWFVAKLVKHTLRDSKPFTSQLIKLIAFKYDTLIPWKVTLSHYNLQYDAPKHDLKYINFNNNIYRKDLTHLEFITIDNDHTQDIDDAIFLRKHGDNINLIIAITDPTSYIAVGSNLDIIASQRLFTNYLPGLNIPMFPKELSENILSLQPHFKKPVLACEVQIDHYGNILNTSNFFLAWIISKAKLTYDNISNWITNTGNWSPKDQKIKNQINLLYELCNKRIVWRKKYALLFKDRIEYKFNFSNNQDITNITIIRRNIAHKMIEEAMIIANLSAAKFLSDNLGFGLYNVHLGFNHLYIGNISYILKKYNININISDINTLEGFCKLRRLLNNISNCYINNRIIKYQSCAFISLIPQPHFALGFKQYLTWTSPIRKYSDFINHRLLKSVILGNPLQKPSNIVLKNIMHCKKKHHIIKKNIENWLYIKYFKKINILNKIFQAEIVNTTPYGMQALLLINGATVFIPIYYINYNKKNIFCDQQYGIYYFQGKKIYQVSDNILVTIIDIQLHTHKIIAKIV